LLQENGYQLLFLSARSILQASQTRQFLISLKQVIQENGDIFCISLSIDFLLLVK